MIRLLKEYFDCFAWSYNEMPGLNRELVEHRLPIKLVSDHSSKSQGHFV
jgi:hypothetical protein